MNTSVLFFPFNLSRLTAVFVRGHPHLLQRPSLLLLLLMLLLGRGRQADCLPWRKERLQKRCTLESGALSWERYVFPSENVCLV